MAFVPFWSPPDPLPEVVPGEPLPFSVTEFYHEAAHFFGSHGMRDRAPAWLAARVIEIEARAARRTDPPVKLAEAKQFASEMATLAAMIRDPGIRAEILATADEREAQIVKDAAEGDHEF